MRTTTTAELALPGESGWQASARAKALEYLPAVGFAVAVLVIWQVSFSVFDVKGYIAASPSEIVDTYKESGGQIWYNAQMTLFEAVAGFALGSAVGALFGIAIAYSRFLERAFLPWAVAATAIPIVAIAPILIVWLGEGAKSKVAVVAFLAFFPVIINTLKGIRSTPRTAIEVMHVEAASPLQEFTKVRLPASLPYVFVGLKLAATSAVIGAIVAEFVGANRGLGYILVQSSYVLDTPMLWACMFASAALGVAAFGAVVLAERIFTPWADTTL